MSAALTITVTGMESIQLFADRLAGVKSDELVGNLLSIIKSQTVRRIDSEKTAPDGGAWKALTASYAATKAEAKPGVGLLEFAGDLRDSINIAQSGDSGEVGTNRIYAATHQFGDSSRGIPQREYMGVSVENDRDIGQEIDAWVQEVLSVGRA